jgi:CheY-like chemotaxis protein
VLIVEDSPTQALRTRFALEAQGFEVVIVNTSREALNTAKEEKPDIVLSDVRMPGVDGFELTQRFRQDPDVSTTPIILNSHPPNPDEDRELALKLGAQDYIQKGLAPDVLANALNEALAKGA